ncbi:MAG: HEAT repeat domain-containing protein [Deltaproteobacteria bacterium]|jgi:HEAT repeat protein|nr:HEAT repeat domain-containing protein [Deltaproteobacteria bacterium]MBW2536847.1 HEAT repeat domain-containing protein [Deltaproteobacteria bacterium]
MKPLASLFASHHAHDSSSKVRSRRRLGPALVLASLVPTLIVLWQGTTLEPNEAAAGDVLPQQQRLSPRQKVLAKIPSDPTVLINVTGREMPASPDIMNLGRRSTRALERCLADNVDAGIRSTCAVVLQAIGDRRALGTLQAALEDWEADVRLQVVQALAAMPDPSSVPPLVSLFQRKDEEGYVRSAALFALGQMSDQRVVQLLRKELRTKPDEDEQDFRSEAFQALWASRHLMARGTLVGDVRQALRSDNDPLVLAATEASAELRSPQLVGALIPLMEHQWPDVRNKAVYALGKIGDRKATKALLARLPKVRESRMLNNIAFALERLDKEAFYRSIQKVIEHKQAVIRLNAAFVLGDVKRAEGLPMLEKALKDSSDFVRTSAVVAVGKLGITDAVAEQAKRALEPYVDDPNLTVKQEAIYALHSLTEGGRPDLLYDRLYKGLNPRKHRQAIQRAAIELGKTGDARVRSYLISCLETYSCRRDDVAPLLRGQRSQLANGRVLLAWARGRDDLTPLVSELRPEGTLPIASSALQAAWARRHPYPTQRAIDVLGSLGEPSVKQLLEPHTGAKQTWRRLHASVALARLGDDQAIGRVLAEMSNLPAEWFPRYVQVVSTISEPAVRAKLDGELEQRQQDQNPVVALAAAAIRLHWSPDQAVFRFLDALASPQGYERDLAERYLKRNKTDRVTWLLRRALARETRDTTRDRLRAILDRRS